MWEKISFHKHLKFDYLKSFSYTSKNAPEFNIKTICLKFLVLVYEPKNLYKTILASKK